MVVTDSVAVTRGIRVEVKASHSKEHSRKAAGVWFFVYTVTITNQGEETVQLLNRHWEITDGNGKVEHVRGAGVVGEQPVLEPGDTFEYSSGCPLATTFGFMGGEYEMEVQGTGERFWAKVAGFPLRLHDESLN